MSVTYVSTFPKENSNNISEMLIKDVQDVEIVKIIDNFIVFKTQKSIGNIKNIEYIKSIFILIKMFEKLTGSYFKPVFQWLGRNIVEELPKYVKIGSKKTVRVILFDKKKIVSNHKNAVRALERDLSRGLGIKTNRLNPTNELWLVHTSDGTGLVMYKI